MYNSTFNQLDEVIFWHCDYHTILGEILDLLPFLKFLQKFPGGLAVKDPVFLLLWLVSLL